MGRIMLTQVDLIRQGRRLLPPIDQRLHESRSAIVIASRSRPKKCRCRPY